jgi:hypothetical protein
MDPSMIEHNADVESGGTAQMTIVVRAVVLVLAISTTLVCGLRVSLFIAKSGTLLTTDSSTSGNSSSTPSDSTIT